MNLSKQAELIIKSNFSKRKKVQKLVFLVSEIPYKRIGSLNPSDMVLHGKGSCTPKHIFLARYLRKLNISVKYLVVPFYYKKLPVKYPRKQLSLIQSMPISYHLALSAELNSKWTILDVTWESQLKGFPHTTKWDGISDMKLGVTPECIIERKSDPRSFEKRMRGDYNSEERKIRKQFYTFFDQFLEHSRQ